MLGRLITKVSTPESHICISQVPTKTRSYAMRNPRVKKGSGQNQFVRGGPMPPCQTREVIEDTTYLTRISDNILSALKFEWTLIF